MAMRPSSSLSCTELHVYPRRLHHAFIRVGVLFDAQRHHRIAKTGLYARMRHPQYVAFVIIMFGFLLQWPTLITLVMFPILAWLYARLARSEERNMSAQFGQEYDQYRQRTPAFIPTFTTRKIAQ